MALTYPLTAHGLELDVLVNRDAAALILFWQVGGRPLPVAGRGLIDTGSDMTSVSPVILQLLGLTPFTHVTTHGIGGPMSVGLYRVSLTIFDARNPSLPWFPHPTLVVMELSPTVPFDALIGLDILRTCKLLADGPGGQFTLEF